MTTFRIIIAGFLGVTLIGTLLLMLPISAREPQWTDVGTALFTSTSAVCVTGLVVRDTAGYWSVFGQSVILTLIQTGGLGVASVAAFFATVSGRRISLLQRSVLQDSISAHQIGGVVKRTGFIFRTAFALEAAGALLLMPAFCGEYGVSGIWMSFFHAVSAFCNAGFDLMGDRTGAFSSLTAFGGRAGVVLPVSLLIIVGGIGYLTWEDIAENRLHFKRYRMQTKTVLAFTGALILLPALVFFFNDFSALPLRERILLSFFQAVTPRTAGFNSADLNAMTGTGRAILTVLMLVGGSPGSTAGGVKVTTAAVLLANTAAAVRRRKSPRLFGRRVEDETVKNAAAIMSMYLILAPLGACVISALEGLPLASCLFETVSAIGTVGLSLGITPALGTVSRLILCGLMFFGRVGGLTLMYAAVSSPGTLTAQCPVEKIIVG